MFVDDKIYVIVSGGPDVRSGLSSTLVHTQKCRTNFCPVLIQCGTQHFIFWYRTGGKSTFKILLNKVSCVPLQLRPLGFSAGKPVHCSDPAEDSVDSAQTNRDFNSIVKSLKEEICGILHDGVIIKKLADLQAASQLLRNCPRPNVADNSALHYSSR